MRTQTRNQEVLGWLGNYFERWVKCCWHSKHQFLFPNIKFSFPIIKFPFPLSIPLSHHQFPLFIIDFLLPIFDFPFSSSIFLSHYQCLLPFFKDYMYLFIYFYREGKGERNKGRETPLCKRIISLFHLAHPQPGTWPATQICALTRNLTGDLSVWGTMSHPQSYTSQGSMSPFNPWFPLPIINFLFASTVSSSIQAIWFWSQNTCSTVCIWGPFIPVSVTSLLRFPIKNQNNFHVPPQ